MATRKGFTLGIRRKGTRQRAEHRRFKSDCMICNWFQERQKPYNRVLTDITVEWLYCTYMQVAEESNQCVKCFTKSRRRKSGATLFSDENGSAHIQYYTPYDSSTGWCSAETAMILVITLLQQRVHTLQPPTQILLPIAAYGLGPSFAHPKRMQKLLQPVLCQVIIGWLAL
jgi:hypothetical protein